MVQTRRTFLMMAATGAAAPIFAAASPQGTPNALKILALFNALPGDKAVKILAPAAAGKPEFRVEMNTAKRMFVGSAIKTFILAETLRQADSPNIVRALTSQKLMLDASVWSVDSATFNPPNLIGSVSVRTALEAMIMHSDNTGTDMSLKHAGPDNVRSFIASAGLRSTEIPESTRVFFAYLLGAKNYKTFTWDELAAASGGTVNSPMNRVETLASSADDFISYYSRALQGEFFKNKETTAEFRRILSLGDAIWLVPLPLGGTAFCKGGSIDVPGYHALCAPGGMLFGDRWVYFAFIHNWYAKEVTDPKTVADFARAASQAMAMVKDAVTA
jgi:beta-lactamase class A